eukprot:2535250-Prymnesium_polylepis.1
MPIEDSWAALGAELDAAKPTSAPGEIDAGNEAEWQTAWERLGVELDKKLTADEELRGHMQNWLREQGGAYADATWQTKAAHKDKVIQEVNAVLGKLMSAKSSGRERAEEIEKYRNEWMEANGCTVQVCDAFNECPVLDA